jgi:chorismate mutase
VLSANAPAHRRPHLGAVHGHAGHPVGVPAVAARQLGIGDVPLLCTQELDIAGGLPLVVRLMAHVETPLARADVRHVYLRGAVALRRDLAQ